MKRTALVTGASRGIGRGIALELARRGWDLVLNYASNQPAAEQTAADCLALAPCRADGIRPRFLLCRANIAVAQDRRALVDFTESSLGIPGMLVNNAGIAPSVRADLLEATEESFDQVVNTNLKGPFLLTQDIARRMVASQGDCRGSRILFVSSISAYTASVNRGDYCISKAGVAMLVKLFASRLAPHGIAVHEIRPGVIATDMTGPVRAKYDALIEGGLTPIRRWGTPEDVGLAVAALAEGFFPFSTGDVLNVDGGFHLRTL